MDDVLLFLKILERLPLNLRKFCKIQNLFQPSFVLASASLFFPPLWVRFTFSPKALLVFLSTDSCGSKVFPH
ncbi:MAG: hypothetical protein D6732_07550 [Methanobacteriota archaeon]|nr:MAG: hypothetical protein D6732_07550 [Euryarchaeota archaeon]